VTPPLTARAVPGVPEIAPGADLAAAIYEAARSSGIELGPEQVLAIAHKVVSKAEGRLVRLADVVPGARARELAERFGKDPRAVEVVLSEAVEILRAERGVLIARTRHGFVCANAGVDASNAPEGTLVLLPEDPDASARRLRARLVTLLGGEAPAVLVTDSFGRAWRHGQCEIAVGLAGLAPLDDWRGRRDSRGLELRATWIAVADQAAALADLVRAKDSHEPAVVIDGLERYVTPEDGPGAAALVRAPQEDLFP
jgi:coenzyme F420-0:L-glutamate ligase / coenzyme F420-1:gamma-L-glutamate ligase